VIPPNGGLVVLDCAYSLEQIRGRGLEHVVTQLDLDGFFDHVWYVQPLLGAAQGEQSVGPTRSTPVTPRHTVIEAPIGRLRLPRGAGLVNLALAQALLFIRLSRLLRRRSASVVAVADPFYLGLWGLALARLHHVALVVKINANYDTSYRSTGVAMYPRLLRWRWLESRIARLVFRHADLVTVGSEDNARYVIDRGAPPERVGMIPTGDMIADAHLQSPQQRPDVAEDLGLTGRPFVVIVTRLEPSKHPDSALLVLAALQRTHPEAALVVVGDGSMRQALERQARELGIDEDVRFVGLRDQRWIARALSAASVVLCPYSGLALVEAAMSGTPIVAYDVEWHAEFISPEETGVLVPYGDVEAMSEAVIALLRDRERGAALAQAARARALREMDRADAVAAKRSAYAAVCAPRCA
jgi:glycosyltransferase involved in cell wall biosynthesis